MSYSRLLSAAVLFLAFCSSAPAQGDLGYRLEQAAALIRDDRMVEAEEQLNGILKSKPRQADALNLLGAIRAKQGKLVAAERLFSQAIRNNRQLISGRMNLAQLYLIKGESNKAVLELKAI